MHSAKSTAGITVTVALITSIISAPTVFAQAATPPAATAATPAIAPAPDILSIPLPPNARLRLDMDARDDDMLGVVKSFLAGMDANTSSLQVLRSAPAVTGAVQTPTGPVPSGQPVDIGKAAAVLLFSDADLSTILDKINHLRLVVFEPRRTNTSRMSTSTVAERQEVIKYYEQKYIEREGGRRMVRGDFDDVQMLVVGFPDRGFAAVFQTPDIGIVFRADGYPDFSGVGPLAMAGLVQMLPSMAPLMR